MKKIFLFFVLTTASSLLTAQNIPSYVPTDSLVGWWPFNGNANDESGNGNNGTVYGATLTSDRMGTSGSAYDFDGINDEIDINNSFFNNGWNDYSISLWFKIQATSQSGASQCMLNTIPHNGFSIGYNHLATPPNRIGHIKNAVPNNISWNVIHPSDGAISGPLLDTSIWINLTLRKTSSVYDYFINGVLDSTKNINNISSIINYWCQLRIGNIAPAPPFGSEPFNGKIDDIGIWNRALSNSEVWILYSGCQDSIQSGPTSSTFQTVPGVAYFTTEHSDTNATYQWQQNAGTGWTNLSDFGIYSGTTTDSLVLTGITSTMNGYGYRCIIDACSMDTTDVAYLTVENNIGLEEINESIVVSPNPTNGALSINLTSAAEYTLYNAAGQVVAQGKTNGNLDITPLPAGSYQLVLTSEGRTSKHSVQKL